MKALNCDRDRRFEDLGALQVVVARALADIDPGFTSASLAEWMRKNFSEDISREVTARNTRERMLQRLGQVSPDERSELTTGEILQMGTLSIKADDKTGSVGRPTRRLRVVLFLTLLLAAGIGLGIWSGWPSIENWLRGAGDPHDAGIRQDAGAITDTEPEVVVDGGPEPLPGDTTGAGDPGQAIAVDGGSTDSGRADRRRRPVRYGYLNINSRPWAHVWVDGKRMQKETPLFKIRLRTGKHRLRFFNPELNIEKIEYVRVRAGKTETISVKLVDP